LALEGLGATLPGELVLDLADVRLVQGLLAAFKLDGLDAATRATLMDLLTTKDVASLRELTAGPAWAAAPQAGEALAALTRLFGGAEVLAKARAVLPSHPLIDAALQDLQSLAQHLGQTQPGVLVGFDLSDLSGHAYYSGTRFAIYGAGHADALVRGGRYDEVGAVFGRRRPAVGFSLDLKILAELLAGRQGLAVRAAVRAPWGNDPALRQAVRELRGQGHTVVCVLPGHEHDVQEFDCDRELALVGTTWTVRPL
jgi:ATP phosphoribosyltransferase regulatory subunit